MEEKKFTNDDVEKVMQGGFNSFDGNNSFSWLYIMLMFALSGKDNGITKDEHIKMKEDISELKGKMSMLEKMM